MGVKLFFWTSVILIAVLLILSVTTDQADVYIGIAIVVDAVLSFYLWNKAYSGDK